MATLIEYSDQNGICREVSNRDPLPVTTSISGRYATKIVTFDGSANNGKNGDTIPLFTVTGLVAMKVYAVVNTTPTSAGGGTIQLGVSTKTGGIIGSTTATSITTGTIWYNTTPSTGGVTDQGNIAEFVVNGNVGLLVGTADVTAGKITFYCLWNPISSDGAVS